MKQWNEKREWKGPAIVQPKLDGVGVTASAKGLFTEAGNEITTQPQINRRLRRYFRHNPGVKLRGELYRHGKAFEDIQAAAQEGGRHSKLRLHVFPEGQEKLPLPIGSIRRVRSRLVESQAQADSEYRRALRKGYEGQVITNAAGTFKRKPYQDAEFKLLGFRPGKPGKVGAALLEGPRGRFKAVLGNANIGERDLGKDVTVKYQRLNRSGIPRGAVVKARRDLERKLNAIEFIYPTESIYQEARAQNPNGVTALRSGLRRKWRRPTASLNALKGLLTMRRIEGRFYGFNPEQTRAIITKAIRSKLLSRRGRVIEFGPLGSKVKWRRPAFDKQLFMRPGSAGYASPVEVRKVGISDPVARKGGIIYTAVARTREIEAKMAGYPSADALDKALVRHELVHSIQDAKRGYRGNQRIRDLLADELGAYATMGRGIKGGFKPLRAWDHVGGFASSMKGGILRHPILRRRALAYAGAGAAGVGGVGLGAAMLVRKRKQSNLSRKVNAIEFSPTEGQKVAGNYAKKHLWFQGLQISIETRKGAIRSGSNKDGDWRVKMPVDYGYIRRTRGADGDHVDVFIGPDKESPLAFVVNRHKANGDFDEHKIFLGFASMSEALMCYQAAYNTPEPKGDMVPTSVAAVKAWLASGNLHAPFDTAEAGMGQTHEFADGKVMDATKRPRRSRMSKETLRRIRNTFIGGVTGAGVGSITWKTAHVGGRLGLGLGALAGAMIPTKRFEDLQRKVKPTEFARGDRATQVLSKLMSPQYANDPDTQMILRKNLQIFRLRHPSPTAAEDLATWRRGTADFIRRARKMSRKLGPKFKPSMLFEAKVKPTEFAYGGRFNTLRSMRRVGPMGELRLPKTNPNRIGSMPELIEQLRRNEYWGDRKVRTPFLNHPQHPMDWFYDEFKLSRRGRVTELDDSPESRQSMLKRARAKLKWLLTRTAEPWKKTDPVVIDPSTIGLLERKARVIEFVSRDSLGGKRIKTSPSGQSYTVDYSALGKRSDKLRAAYGDAMQYGSGFKKNPVKIIEKITADDWAKGRSLAYKKGVVQNAYMGAEMVGIRGLPARAIIRKAITKKFSRRGAVIEFGSMGIKRLDRVRKSLSLAPFHRHPEQMKLQRVNQSRHYYKYGDGHDREEAKFKDFLATKMPEWTDGFWPRHEYYSKRRHKLGRRGPVIEFISPEPNRRRMVIGINAQGDVRPLGIDYSNYPTRAAKNAAAYVDGSLWLRYGRGKPEALPMIEKTMRAGWAAADTLKGRKAVLRAGRFAGRLAGLSPTETKAIIRKAITKKFSRKGKIVEFGSMGARRLGRVGYSLSPFGRRGATAPFEVIDREFNKVVAKGAWKARQAALRGSLRGVKGAKRQAHRIGEWMLASMGDKRPSMARKIIDHYRDMMWYKPYKLERRGPVTEFKAFVGQDPVTGEWRDDRSKFRRNLPKVAGMVLAGAGLIGAHAVFRQAKTGFAKGTSHLRGWGQTAAQAAADDAKEAGILAGQQAAKKAAREAKREADKAARKLEREAAKRGNIPRLEVPGFSGDANRSAAATTAKPKTPPPESEWTGHGFQPVNAAQRNQAGIDRAKRARLARQEGSHMTAPAPQNVKGAQKITNRATERAKKEHKPTEKKKYTYNGFIEDMHDPRIARNRRANAKIARRNAKPQVKLPKVKKPTTPQPMKKAPKKKPRRLEANLRSIEFASNEPRKSHLLRNTLLAGAAYGIGSTARGWHALKGLRGFTDKPVGTVLADAIKRGHMRNVDDVRSLYHGAWAKYHARGVARTPLSPSRWTKAGYHLANYNEIPIGRKVREAAMNKRLFSRAAKPIEFSNPRNWEDNWKFSPALGPGATYRKGRRMVPVVRRTGEVFQDINDIATGVPKKPGQKRFYEKSWFKSALMGVGLGGSIFAQRHRILAHTNTGIDPWAKYPLLRHIPRVLFADRRKVTEFAGNSEGARAGWETKRLMMEQAMAAGQGGWRINDARGNSARVYHPGSRPRQRREKKWHERTAFLRTLGMVGLGLGAAGAAYGGAAMTRDMLKRQFLKKGGGSFGKRPPRIRWPRPKSPTETYTPKPSFH